MGAALKQDDDKKSPRRPTSAPPMSGRRSGFAAALGSAALHIAVAGGLLIVASVPQKRPPDSVRVKIQEVAKPKPPEPPPPVADKPPEPPKPPEKPKKKPPEKKRASERKPEKKPPDKPAAPVQGLTANSTSPLGTGLAAPIGNTLNTADEGKRLKAEDVQSLTDEDLTADASLIRASVQTPQYTDQAIDAELEGLFTVEVYVDASGSVTDAQLPKKIGYGMDERVLAAARKARFNPRKDRLGKALAGWTEMKFRLEIPH